MVWVEFGVGLVLGIVIGVGLLSALALVYREEG